jgi:hypothetical protein
MNTILSRTLGKALSILSHSLISVGLIQGINSPLYAQTLATGCNHVVPLPEKAP